MELKNFDVYTFDNQVEATPTTGPKRIDIFQLSQGNSAVQRIGRRVIAKSLEYRIRAVIGNAETNVNNRYTQPGCLRVMIVYDEHGAVDVLNPPMPLSLEDILSFSNPTWRNRFVFLVDKIMCFDTYCSKGTQNTISWNRTVGYINGEILLDIESTFLGSGSQATTGGYFIYLITDIPLGAGDALGIHVDTGTRINFIDA